MADYVTGYEKRHGVPGPEGSGPANKARSNAPREPGTDSTPAGARAKSGGEQAAGEREHCEIPGTLAPQITQPNA